MTESSSVSVCKAVSSVLSVLQEERALSYTQSGIQLVTEVDNKYPLSDVIMKSYTGIKNSKGVLEGHGAVEFKDGHSYEGEFHQGVMHGQGRYVWKDGLVYEGEFRDCKITGLGKYTWPDGSTYTGEVESGLRHGQGTYRCSVTGSTYVGQWVSGRRQGHGRLKYRSTGGEEGACYYNGDWVDNQQKGFGTRRYRSGNVYEGEWSGNKRHGKGTMHWYDRGESYTGQWVKGVQHGQGEHMWLVHGSDNAQYPLCNRYDGSWVHGKRQGFGTFYYANGSKYIGEWQEDLKHGRGKFVFQSGQVFEGEFRQDKMIGDISSNQKAGLLRPQTPLGSLIGDIDHSDIISGGSVTEKFNLEISKLFPETDIQHELRQIHCVLMRYITQLKKVYHHYSSLGSGSTDFGNLGYVRCCTLTQMQLWRLLLDCKIHHHGTTLYYVDYIIHPDAPPSEVHDPNNTFLMREFLQILVFLSHHLISSPGEDRAGDLSQKLSTFITAHLLPHACNVGGTLYCQTPECIVQALKYQQEVWQLYQQIQSNTTNAVGLRDILLLLKEHGLVSSSYPASSVVREMVKDSPLAVDGEDYNLEVKVVFLEFFEILLLCAQGWYKEERSKMKNSEPAEVKLELSVPILLVTSDAEVNENNKTSIHEFEGVSPAIGVPLKQKSEIEVTEDQLSEQQSQEAVEGEDGEGCESEGKVSHRDEKMEASESQDEYFVEVVSDAEQELYWKEMLQAFFSKHLLSSTLPSML